MIALIAKEAYRVGLFKIRWVIEDSVDFGDIICKFDFKAKNVVAMEDSSCREIGKIVSYKKKRLDPFRGIITVGDFNIETRARFLDILEVTLKGKGLESKIVIDWDYKKGFFGDLLKWRFDFENKKIEIQCQEGYCDLAYVLGSIMFKKKMYVTGPRNA